MLKRSFDIVSSLLGLFLLLPLFFLIGIWIRFDSRGKIFYRQLRVGRHGKDFFLIKFRTMKIGADNGGLLTIGGRDPRITSSGYFLRKYKLDELPQLLNVIFGEMSLVGPRPEVRKYVNKYTPEQLQVLYVRPGITDYASIKFSNENELLAKAPDPERFYVNEVMPEKLRLNLRYIHEQSFITDLKIILQTIAKVSGK